MAGDVTKLLEPNVAYQAWNNATWQSSQNHRLSGTDVVHVTLTYVLDV